VTPKLTEADVTINGVTLTFAQSATLRVAISSMLTELSNSEHMTALGAIGPLYQKRLREIEHLIVFGKEI